MGKSPDNRSSPGESENPTASDSSAPAGRIPSAESDGLAARVREVVGDMPVRAFAKLADISEGTLRNMMLANDVSPRADNLAAVARVGNVMVDWLLTGLPPKRRHDFDVLAFNTSPEGITTLHIAEAKTYAAEPRASYGQPLRPDEAELLEKYRSAGDVGRHALNKVAKAVAGRSMRAWFDAGVAVSEAASILDQDK